MTDTTAIIPGPSDELAGRDERTEARSRLQPVAATADRERARLEAVAGKSVPLAALLILRLRMRHLGSDEAAKSGLRYQPVAWTAIAIVAIAGFFPGRQDSGPIRGDLAQAPGLVAPATTTTVPEAPAGPAVFAAPDFEFTFAPPIPVPAPFVPTITPSPSVSQEPVVAPVIPLSVRGFGWAGSLSGTGLGTTTVPDGTMPVGSRLGELDKASFVRLSGTTTSLVLTEDTSGAREALGAGLVRACAIVESDWAEVPDQSFEDAPEIDTDQCVTGIEDDNTWTFDLSRFANRTSQAGFALLPAAGAPPDFQITFQPT